MGISAKKIVSVMLVAVFAVSVVTAPTSSAASGTSNGRAACGTGYKLNRSTTTKTSGGSSKIVVLEVYEKGTTLCAVSVKIGAGKGKKDGTIGVLLNYEKTDYHKSDSGKYKYYAGPLKKGVGKKGCITVQGWYKSDKTNLIKACEAYSTY